MLTIKLNRLPEIKDQTEWSEKRSKIKNKVTYTSTVFNLENDGSNLGYGTLRKAKMTEEEKG